MSRISTMGTFSCATIAIAGFKPEHRAADQKYLADKDPLIAKAAEKSIQHFYNTVLYPTSQPLGKSDEFPFEALMEALNGHAMGDKFIIATLNQHQTQVDDGYWAKRLAHWGFELIDKTNNSIGQVCMIYTRNRNRVPL